MQFPDIARNAFSFLERVGFRLMHTSPTQLQYETPQVFVTIDWDARSGELNAYLGLQPRKDEVRDQFSLTDILAMRDVDVPERKMPFQVAEESKLGPFVERLAADMQVHAQQALTGDRMFFHRLKAFRNAHAEIYMHDMELRRVRTEADEAWQKKELEKVASLYTSIEKYLSESEKGKLAYAKNHLTRDRG